MTEKEYWFWLCGCPQIWQQDINKLLYHFGSPKKVFEATDKELKRCRAITNEQAKLLIQRRETMKCLDELEKMEKEGIRFISISDPEYPEMLKDCWDSPYALYVKGNLPDPRKRSVGMVGARACSAYGRKMANEISTALARVGVQIISGMALGIDAECARAAIAAGGKTFAVLGGGVDVIYPRENIELYYSILMNGGGIISEYPLKTPPIAWQFPHRNRLISGLSERLIVIEARKRSGTLTTASHALNQGKDICVVPGRIGDALSEGCNKLIYDGAGIILSVSDLLEDFTGEKLQNPGMVNENSNENIGYGNVLEVLEGETLSCAEIAKRCGISEKECSMILTELELFGSIMQVSVDQYEKK